MSIHVVQLGPYPPPEGGISRHILAIRDRLRSEGHRCSIVATSRSSEVREEPDVFHPRSAAEIVRLLTTIDLDVLHLHIGGEIDRRVLALAATCSVLANGRSVLTLHSGGYPHTKKARQARPGSARGRIFRRFTRVIAVNEELASVFERYGIDSERLAIAPPFSLSQPDEKVTVPAEVKEFYRSHSPLLVSVGGLETDYDPVFQIDAMAEMVLKHPQAGLVMVGGGAMHEEVAQYVEQHGLRDSIMIAGDVEHSRTLHLIRDADAMIRTTLFDGDAISVREALFLGTPVVATNTAPRPEGVRLFEMGDRRGFLQALDSALSHGGIESAEYSEDNIGQVLNIYRSIVR